MKKLREWKKNDDSLIRSRRGNIIENLINKLLSFCTTCYRKHSLGIISSIVSSLESLFMHIGIFIYIYITDTYSCASFWEV